jgi:hypothetical protein
MRMKLCLCGTNARERREGIEARETWGAAILYGIASGLATTAGLRHHYPTAGISTSRHHPILGLDLGLGLIPVPLDPFGS